MRPNICDVMQFEFCIFDAYSNKEVCESEWVYANSYEEMTEIYNTAEREWGITNLDDIGTVKINGKISFPNCDLFSQFAYIYNNWYEIYWVCDVLLTLDISLKTINELLEKYSISEMQNKIENATTYILCGD